MDGNPPPEPWCLIEAKFREALVRLTEAEQAFNATVVRMTEKLCGVTEWLREAGENPDEHQNVRLLSGPRFKTASRRLEQSMNEVVGLEAARTAALAAQDRFARAARRVLEARVDTPELLDTKLGVLMLLQSRAREQSYPEIASNPEHCLPPIDYLTHLNGPGGLSDVLMSVRADVWLFARKADERRAG